MASLAFMVILLKNENLQNHAFIYSYRIIMVFFLIISYVDIGRQVLFGSPAYEGFIMTTTNKNTTALYY